MPYCTQWFPMRSAERPSCGFARGARWAGIALQIAVPSLTTPSPPAMSWTPTSTAARSHAGQGIRRTRAHLSRPPSCASLPHGLLIREAEARAGLPSRPPSMPLVHSDDARPQELLGSSTGAVVLEDPCGSVRPPGHLSLALKGRTFQFLRGDWSDHCPGEQLGRSGTAPGRARRVSGHIFLYLCRYMDLYVYFRVIGIASGPLLLSRTTEGPDDRPAPRAAVGSATHRGQSAGSTTTRR